MDISISLLDSSYERHQSTYGIVVDARGAGTVVRRHSRCGPERNVKTVRRRDLQKRHVPSGYFGELNDDVRLISEIPLTRLEVVCRVSPSP